MASISLIFADQPSTKGRIKRQWGAQPVQLYWQYLMDGQNSIPDLNPSNPRYQTAIRIWQRLPLPVTRLLALMIVRNIP